jgi:NADH dehydrogenase
MNRNKHMVVLGAGFGGLMFCKHFQMADARLTVVDRTNYHLFQPLLYQVAACGLSAPEIVQPIRSILSNRPDGCGTGRCIRRTGANGFEARFSPH